MERSQDDNTTKNETWKTLKKILACQSTFPHVQTVHTDITTQKQQQQTTNKQNKAKNNNNNKNQQRMEQVLHENQRREQAGFRKCYSTIDHLQTFNQLIDNCNEFKRPLCIGYIAYANAFEHGAIFKAVRTMGINETSITTLEDTYTGATARVRMKHQVSEEIPILRGVRQGDPIFPILFTATIDEVFKNAQLEEKGIHIDDEKLSDLRFADDVSLTTNDVKDMEHKLNIVNEVKTDLRMHKGKSKFMTNIDITGSIQIDRSHCLRVQSFHPAWPWNPNQTRLWQGCETQTTDHRWILQEQVIYVQH